MLQTVIVLCTTQPPGEMCETNIDECLSAPCQNGGQCVDGVNSFNCECGEAFMGEFCEEEYDACASSPCHNGASCITTLGQQDFYCECIPGQQLDYPRTVFMVRC